MDHLKTIQVVAVMTFSTRVVIECHWKPGFIDPVVSRVKLHCKNGGQYEDARGPENYSFHSALFFEETSREGALTAFSKKYFRYYTLSDCASVS
jgi:hypothetical protein